jgi:hypothetical protein
MVSNQEVIRNRNRAQLRKSLTEALETSKVLVSQASDAALKHLAIKKSREDMFEIYDSAISKNCSDESEMDNKKKVVRDAWKVLTLFLFRLDHLDMHNGCYSADIAFPSVIYD